MNLKRTYTLLAATLLLLLLAGCSSGNAEPVTMEPDTFSKQDMAIYKAVNSKERVSYGMSRKNAEKVLGTGNKGIPNSYTYDPGVSVIYRDDKVVSIALRKESQGVYRTARGAEAGMSHAGIKKLYGEKYAIENAENYMDYYYDTETRQLVKSSVQELNSLSGEALRGIHMISTVYDEEGKATIIILMDMQAATTMK
ncbi:MULTISPECIES: hypothetical protein [unclassified Paenibacillus]|uniref:hypothetical protein n=1 Tax=unclassified Paenibacillus TaxID=185978 RepID=UPI0030F8AE54